MESFLLSEGVLNDDILMVAEDGEIFKGGYIAIVEIRVFKNSWANDTKYVRFRSKERLTKFLEKNYPDFNDYV